MLFATFARQSFEVLLFRNRSPSDSSSIETSLYILDKSRYPIPIADDRVCQMKDERYSMFEAEILNTFRYKNGYLMLTLKF